MYHGGVAAGLLCLALARVRCAMFVLLGFSLSLSVSKWSIRSNPLGRQAYFVTILFALEG